MSLDDEAGAAKHCLHRGPVGYEPVRRIGRIPFLHEKQFGISGILEHGPFGKRVIFFEVGYSPVTPLERLEEHHVGCDMFVDEIERQQRMPQMVKYAHEDHEVETLFKLGHVINRQLPELYVESSHDIAEAGLVVRLPSELDGDPFPGEPLGCAMNIFERSGIEAGQTVAIIGIGFIGALLTQLAARRGARVIAISRRTFSLEIAHRMGATELVEMDDHWRIIECVRQLTDGRFCDRVIEAVGKQWPLDLAGELTAERGRLIIAGYHQDGPHQINMQLWNWRGLDVINAHERDPAIYISGMRKAVAAVAAGELDPSTLYTHRYTLNDLDRALNDTRDRPESFLKALITYP